jgi:pimeloyl-ACP methyl ester carboxylesterase
MDITTVNGVELEYEVTGAGEPVLLISPILPDGFLPIVDEPVLADFRLIRYHKRGWVGSTHRAGPVSVAEHAADAAALLSHLGVSKAHIVGHSSGAAVGAELATQRPELVHTLSLLELTLLSVPAAGGFFAQAGPAFEAYGNGDHETALALFMIVASGLEWPSCEAVLEAAVPGLVTQTAKDADTLFGIELPALGEWSFDAERAATVGCPVLSVLGSETHPLWVDVAAFLRASVPAVEESTIDGVGHLLHLQDAPPVAQAIAQFLTKHPINVR